MTQGEKFLKEAEKRIQQEMNNILANDVHFYREHKFAAEELAIRYKYDGLELARNIIWDIERENNIHL